MNTYLLVFDDGNGSKIDLARFVDRLEDGAEMYTLDGHVCFIRSGLNLSDVTSRFMELVGSNLFFVTEIGNSEYSGRMVGPFWDFLKPPSIASAA